MADFARHEGFEEPAERQKVHLHDSTVGSRKRKENVLTLQR
jgi:hypothetical protein